MPVLKDPFNVIIGGVGGQGNVLASQILGEMLISQDYRVTIGETYGASQRGGAVMSHLRISRRDQLSPLIPEGQCDFLMALEPIEGLRILDYYGNPRIMTLVNTRPVQTMDVLAGNVIYPEISKVIKTIQGLSGRVWTIRATEIALEIGDPIFSNIVMLGALCRLDLLPISRDQFRLVIEDLLPSRKTDENLMAFDRGTEAVKEFHG